MSLYYFVNFLAKGLWFQKKEVKYIHEEPQTLYNFNGSVNYFFNGMAHCNETEAV